MYRSPICLNCAYWHWNGNGDHFMCINSESESHEIYTDYDSTCDCFELAEWIEYTKPSEWISNHDGTWNCSNCGLRVLIYAKGNYCPNCGVKMEE